MAEWRVTIRGKGIRKASVEKLANKLKSEFGDDASINVVDSSPPESRADRFSYAMGLVAEARDECESLLDELQEWFDNLPEAFQSGDKGSELEEAIGELENAISNCEELEGTDITFPSMY